MISTYFTHTDADDGYYIAISNIAVETDEIVLDGDLVYEGYSQETQGVRSYTFTWELLVAFISKLLVVEPIVLCHSILPFLLIVVCYLAYYELGLNMFSDNNKAFIFVFVLSIIILFSGYSLKSPGLFLIVRLWQGKALLPNLAFVALLSNCFYLYNGMRTNARIYYRDWFLNSIIIVSGMAFSSVGLYLMPIYYLIIGISIVMLFIISKAYQSVVVSIKKAVITVIPVIVLDIIYMIQILSSTAVKNYSEAIPPSYNAVIYDVLFRKNYFILLIICSLFLLLAFRKETGTKLLLGSTMISFLTFLNPLFSGFVAQKITGVDVYWRLFWCVPMYLLIGYAVVMIITTRKKQITCTLLACGVIGISGQFVYEKDLFFTEHWNKYRLPQEVIEVSESLLEVDDELIVCGFPADISFYIRQYSSTINVIYARNMDISQRIIKGTDKSYSWLYSKLYCEYDYDSKDVIEALGSIGVNYIYTRIPIESKYFVSLDKIGNYGYIYKINSKNH